MRATLGRNTAQDSALNVLLLSLMTLMCAFAALWVWFAVGANYDYTALAGSYSAQDGGVSCTLRLTANQTFHQEVTVEGHKVVTDGVWSRYGEHHVSFANLLAYPFQDDIASVHNGATQRNIHRELEGEFVKAFAVYPKLEIQGHPVLRKHFWTR